jgi:hypothetical protein
MARNEKIGFLDRKKAGVLARVVTQTVEKKGEG